MSTSLAVLCHRSHTDSCFSISLSPVLCHHRPSLLHQILCSILHTPCVLSPIHLAYCCHIVFIICLLDLKYAASSYFLWLQSRYQAMFTNSLGFTPFPSSEYVPVCPNLSPAPGPFLHSGICTVCLFYSDFVRCASTKYPTFPFVNLNPLQISKL